MMLRAGAIFAALCLATGGLSAASAQDAADDPVVVELFTAQGCAACADTGEFAADLAERPDVLVLTYPVDYWDYLGWRDTFAKPEFSDRQRAYQQALQLRGLYTPQAVIDGRREAMAVRPAEVIRAIDAEGERPASGPDVAVIDRTGELAVGAGRAPSDGADVWLIRYEPRPDPVRVRRGENRGRSLEHANVVRELVRLGRWTGRPVRMDLPAAAEEGLEGVVLVQAADGAILAAHRL
ncbi:thioredoxin family protein [Brevundimonas sp.]|uniref:DUF1223 domain-containing protein n=1 Tax=Brevundimonas sp. TaxID=1871086 RepID=UPI0025E5D638|nr:DUF1223 domain-containing protein [Brevundimonas sp.]